MILTMIMTLTLNFKTNHNPQPNLIVLSLVHKFAVLWLCQRSHFFPWKTLQSQLTETFIHITKHLSTALPCALPTHIVAHAHTLNGPMTHIMELSYRTHRLLFTQITGHMLPTSEGTPFTSECTLIHIKGSPPYSHQEQSLNISENYPYTPQWGMSIYLTRYKIYFFPSTPY